MTTDIVPQRLIGLNELKTSDMKLRRLFIMIDGKKNIQELTNATHLDLEECKEKIMQLLELGAIQAEGFSVQESNDENIDDELDKQILECTDFHDCLKKSLSLFIGPVASLIVEKKVPKKEQMHISEMHEFVDKLSVEIDKPEDRIKFVNIIKAKISEKI